MKTIAWTLALALLVSAPATAQRPGGPGGRAPGDRPGMMRGPAGVERAVELALERRDSLGLSADQVQRREAFKGELERSRTELREEMERAREQSDDRAEVRERMEERMRAARES